MIPFNKPYLTGKETFYIEEAVKLAFSKKRQSEKITDNG
jgi:hypothetical protein